MGKLKITDFFIYRYRYFASYVLIGFILIALLFVSGVLVPGGISSLEMEAATRSGNISLNALIGMQPESIVSLPYRLLQLASMSLLGVSVFSVKLPSLILAAGAILLLFGTLQLWFRRNVAIITTIITMTSSQFLLQSQSGTYGIIYMFWAAVLLFTASKIAAAQTLRPLWFILTAITAGLALYTPYMLYIIIPLVVAAFVHPHARFVVFRQPIWAMLLAGVLFAASLVPLITSALQQPAILMEVFFGAAIADGTLSLGQNVSQLIQFVDFYNGQGGRILQPAFGLGLLLLAVVGLFRLLSAKYTAKSYILSIWLLLTIPVFFISPTVAAASAILPIAILNAFAIDLLIRRWYTMFPLNPYARVAGLAPLGILVLVLSVSSMDRFIYGYQYDPAAVTAYTDDVSLLTDEIEDSPSSAVVVVPENELAFYQSYMRFNQLEDTVTVTSTPPINLSGRTIISGVIIDRTNRVESPSRIVVSQTKENANRFYVYEK